MRETVMAWTIAWEGCLGLYKARRSEGHSFQIIPVVDVSNTNRELLEAFAKLVGYGKVYHQSNHHHDGTNWKDMHKWQLTSLETVKRFCEEILPYLPAKKEQAEILIRFAKRRMEVATSGIRTCDKHTTWTTLDFTDEEQMSILNQRGKEGRKRWMALPLVWSKAASTF